MIPPMTAPIAAVANHARWPEGSVKMTGLPIDAGEAYSKIKEKTGNQVIR
jgi:hypothetical protein